MAGTVLVVDPGITATGGWLPDLGLLKDWVGVRYGPLRKAIAYVTYQPRAWMGTEEDDGTDGRRDRFVEHLRYSGYTDISTVYSTITKSGIPKCNVDTYIMRDIWTAMVRQDDYYSPLTGYHRRPVRGPYDTLVLVTGDWDIVGPTVLSERVTGHQPSLLDLGVRVVVMFKEGQTNHHVLDMAWAGDIEFVPLDNHKQELLRC